MRRTAAAIALIACWVVLGQAQESDAEALIVRTAYHYSDEVMKDVRQCRIYQGSPPLLVTVVGAAEKQVSKLYMLQGGKAVPAAGLDGKPIVASEFLKSDGIHGGLRGELPNALWYREKWHGLSRLLTVQDGKVFVHSHEFTRDVTYRQVTYQAGRFWVTAVNWRTTTDGNTTSTERWVELWYTDGAELKRATDADGNFADAGELITATAMADGGVFISGSSQWLMRDGVFMRVKKSQPPKELDVRDTSTRAIGYRDGVVYLSQNAQKKLSGLWRHTGEDDDEGVVREWIRDQDGVPLLYPTLQATLVGDALWVRATREKAEPAEEPDNEAMIFRVQSGAATRIKSVKPFTRGLRFVKSHPGEFLEYDTGESYEYYRIMDDTVSPILLPDGTTLTSGRGYSASFYTNGQVCHAWLPKLGRFRVTGTSAIALKSDFELKPTDAVPSIMLCRGHEVIAWQDPKDSFKHTFGVVGADGSVVALQREHNDKLWDMGMREWNGAQGADGLYFQASVRDSRGPYMVYYLR